MTADETRPAPVSRRRLVLTAAVVVAVLVLGALAWRWYDDPSRRADAARDDIADIPGVAEVVDEGDVPEVRLTEDATTDEIATVLEEAADYSEAVEEADGAGFVAVRRGVAVVHVGAGLAPVDPALLTAVGGWSAPEGLDVLLVQWADGVALRGTSPATPAVTTVAWLVEQAATLDNPLLGSVHELAATNEETGTTARITDAAARDLTASGALVAALAGLADLDPEAVVTAPDLAMVDVASAPGQEQETRQRVERALHAFPETLLRVTG